MQLEDYFESLETGAIRIKGHRIGIECVLEHYLHHDLTPEEIQRALPTLSLEDVYATILYYLHYREIVDKYLVDYQEICHRNEAEYDSEPPSKWLQAMRKLKAERDARVAGS